MSSSVKKAYQSNISESAQISRMHGAMDEFLEQIALLGDLSLMVDTVSPTKLRELAARLEFKVEQHGDRFTLTRTTDVSRPVVEEGLTLSEAEELLERWKLRGLGGG
jgi:hypothetical protein